MTDILLQHEEESSQNRRHHNTHPINLPHRLHRRHRRTLFPIRTRRTRHRRTPKARVHHPTGHRLPPRRSRSRGRGGGVNTRRVLGAAGIVGAAGVGARVVLAAVGDALVVGLAADEVGDCLAVFGGVGRGAVLADAGVGEGVLFSDQGWLATVRARRVIRGRRRRERMRLDE